MTYAYIIIGRIIKKCKSHHTLYRLYLYSHPNIAAHFTKKGDYVLEFLGNQIIIFNTIIVMTLDSMCKG